EGELGGRFGVSRSSGRQARVGLEVPGRVEVRHGDGVYLVREIGYVDTLQRLIERRQRLPDVLDAREALETKLAELAARRRSDESLAAMRRALDDMEADIAAGDIGTVGDARFHQAVATA